MSRIGKKPIILPNGTKAVLSGNKLSVTGSLGTLELEVHPQVFVEVSADQILVSVKHPENKKEKALWGLSRSLVQNIVDGVNKPYEKKLEVNGVGFKVAVDAGKLNMSLGFSHPVNVDIPKDLQVSVEKNIITISGIDKQKVGQFAANVRSLKKPEPYKGKGIKYIDETIIRKAGKVVKAVGGGK